MNVVCRKCGCLRIHDYDTICNFCGTPFETYYYEDNYDGIGFHDDSEKYPQQTELAEQKQVFAQMKDICIPVAPCTTIEECQRMVWNYEYLQNQYRQLKNKKSSNVAGKIISFFILLSCLGTLKTVFGITGHGVIYRMMGGFFSALSSILPLAVILMVVSKQNNNIRQLTFHYNQYTQAKRVLRKNNILQ